MKTIHLIIAFLALSIFTISCSKDDATQEPIKYPEENPLDAFLAASGFNQKIVEVKNKSGSYEYGFSFKPTQTGKINAFVVKIPDFNISNLRVTIWDVETKKAISTESIIVPKANVAVEKVIVPIPLTKDKEYFITLNTKDWFWRSKTDESDVVYPFVVGNITVTGCGYSTSGFPSITQKDRYHGDVSFLFERTE